MSTHVQAVPAFDWTPYAIVAIAGGALALSSFNQADAAEPKLTLAQWKDSIDSGTPWDHS